VYLPTRTKVEHRSSVISIGEVIANLVCVPL
jgi:hypothetical protein